MGFSIKKLLKSVILGKSGVVMSKIFSPAAAGIVMYITKYFLWTNGEIKTAIFYMSSHLKQIFASQNFLGGERYVFLLDTMVGRNFFQGGYPPEKIFAPP